MEIAPSGLCRSPHRRLHSRRIPLSPHRRDMPRSTSSYRRRHFRDSLTTNIFKAIRWLFYCGLRHQRPSPSRRRTSIVSETIDAGEGQPPPYSTSTSRVLLSTLEKTDTQHPFSSQLRHLFLQRSSKSLWSPVHPAFWTASLRLFARSRPRLIPTRARLRSRGVRLHSP